MDSERVARLVSMEIYLMKNEVLEDNRSLF